MVSECLRSHPDIFVSSPKEIKYFLYHENKGIELVWVFFEKGKNLRYGCEFASNYIYNENCALKILNILGRVKFVIVRPPVERTLSHIKHLVRNNDISIKGSIIGLNQLKELVLKYPEILIIEHYQNLNNYYNTFTAENIFLANQYDCQKKPVVVLKTYVIF